METFLFLGLNISAWLTIITVVTVFGLMIFTKLPADTVFLGSTAFLYVTGVLNTSEALSGFSSSSVVTVGVLFVVICGLVQTGVLQWVTNRLLGTPKNYKSAVIRLMLPVAGLSAFLSNTAVVAMFIQIVSIWSKKLNITPSRLLIPLSYASGMGGVCTLIGTPPNLIVSGLYQETGATPMEIFTTLPIGLICLAVGVLSLLAMSKLLPERTSPSDSLSDTADYTVELLVPSTCPHIGKTLKESGLYHPKGGSLIELLRFDKEVISPVSPDEFIFGGDRLIYSGDVEDILQLRKEKGLVSASKQVFVLEKDEHSKRSLRMGTITFHSSFIGKKMEELSFEKDQDTVLVAIARQGSRINEAPREVVLEAGDTLLLESSKSSLKIENQSFTDLQIDPDQQLVQTGKQTFISAFIMIGMVVLSSLKVMSLLQACFLAAFAMLFTRCCSINAARKSIDWSILMIFAGSVCLGSAIEKSGLASLAAENILSVFGSNPFWVLAALYLVTTFVTEFVSNTATAAIFYPIAYNSAIAMNVSPMPFLIVLMVAASSSFATPIGSPTHMMVYGPGGYHFTDFIRIGLPMNLIIMITALLTIPLIWPF